MEKGNCLYVPSARNEFLVIYLKANVNDVKTDNRGCLQG
jgi:hypothetical protein